MATTTIADLPPLVLTREWKYHCTACSDSGWRDFWCGVPARETLPDVDYRICGRERDHAPHGWVERCPCEKTNPDIQKRKQRWTAKRDEKDA